MDVGRLVRTRPVVVQSTGVPYTIVRVHLVPADSYISGHRSLMFAVPCWLTVFRGNTSAHCTTLPVTFVR